MAFLTKLNSNDIKKICLDYNIKKRGDNNENAQCVCVYQKKCSTNMLR